LGCSKAEIELKQTAFDMKEVNEQRWQIAQESEQEFWDKEYADTEALKKESGDRYPKKAKIVVEEWNNFKKLDKNTKVLQVGSGPEDIINYLPFKNRYAIDPLADFYKKKFKLDFKSFNLTKGTGESIPFKDKTFDVVILINVLDHVHLPQKTLSEIKRVMKPDAIFHFEDYFYQKGFLALAKPYALLKRKLTGQIFNIHHPYMFSKQELHNLIDSNFSIIREESGRDIGMYENLSELKKQVLKDKHLIKRILARFGIYGIINYSAICKIKA
jgi:ubiquinone/menaquinone biosynthesis C-methylase UbiE